VAGVRVFVRLDELNSARPDSVVASGATSVVSIVVPRLLLTATTFDGLPLVVQTLATGLKAPSAIVPAPDGRVFIDGRDGKILVWQPGKILSSPALLLSDAAQTSDLGLIGMSLDPAFGSNGLVFVAYTARDQRRGLSRTR